jgi:hypothetical protein
MLQIWSPARGSAKARDCARCRSSKFSAPKPPRTMALTALHSSVRAAVCCCFVCARSVHHARSWPCMICSSEGGERLSAGARARRITACYHADLLVSHRHSLQSDAGMCDASEDQLASARTRIQLRHTPRPPHRNWQAGRPRLRTQGIPGSSGIRQSQRKRIAFEVS